VTTKAADDFESIARRLNELEAERQLALTGSSAPVKLPEPSGAAFDAVGMYTWASKEVGEYATGWPAHSVEDTYG
jgi:hypothetical protein